MRLELRCEHKMHGILESEGLSGTFEVRCDSGLCGKRPGVVVLHTIDLETGRVETKRYKQPPSGRSADASGIKHPALRSP